MNWFYLSKRINLRNISKSELKINRNCNPEPFSQTVTICSIFIPQRATKAEILANCHNPTNNLKQLKTTFVGVVLLSVKKTTTTTPHHTTPGLITIRAILGNLGSWFSVCNLILTKLDDIWKMTSFFVKWKTTSIFSQMEDDLNFFSPVNVSLHFFQKGRQSQFSVEWKTTSISFKWKMTAIFLWIEDNLKKNNAT